MLEPLGLTQAEAQIYLAVLERGGADTAELAQVLVPSVAAGLEQTLEVLHQRGLIERVATGPSRYRPVDPAVALADHVAAKERDLQQSRKLVEELAEQYVQGAKPWQVRPQDLVEIVVGAREVMERLRGEHRRAQREVRSMERPPYVQVNTEPNPIEMELLARGVVHRVIYEEDAIDLPGRLNDVIKGIEAGEQARVAPRLPARVLLIDDEVALLPARAGGLFTDALLIVHPGALLELLSELFEVAWEHAMPLRVTAGGLKDESADEQLVLSLLASGLTDDAMARHLGVSVRTVQRRVREICARLGARTRFQAGLQAGRQGLL
ncbi:MAG TPA: helix-turn-helix domain-containing protein [Micromonosporaceae bacterium]|nr:helix-turn-helix domain-containing protein [Micromonosporaceae bacterium]